MKKSYNLKVLLLAFVLSLSVLCSFGCTPTEQGGGGGKQPIKPTDIDFVSNGKANYTLVIPQSPEPKEIMAKDEIIYFTRLATSAEVEWVYDNQVSASSSNNYISIGDTSLRGNSGAQFLRDELGKTGFKIINKSNVLYVSGANHYGTLGGAYQFLYHMFGYEFFAPGEIKINSTQNCKMLDFQLSIIPSIDVRANDYKEILNDTATVDRYGFVEYWRDWIMHGHSYFTIVPPEKYYKTNRDWYSPDCMENGMSSSGTAHGNMCLTNVNVDVFFENLVPIIEANPTSEYVNLGQMDNFAFCNCDDCLAEIAKYGSTNSILVVRFTNAIARKVKAKFPDRNLRVVAFAYNATLNPPTKWVAPTKDNEQGYYEPVDSSVVTDDNVSILFVPQSFNYSYGYDSQLNMLNNNRLSGWEAVCNNMLVWEYLVNFDNPMMNYNNWGSLKSMYERYEKIGVDYMFEQGAGSLDTTVNSFSFMKLYVMSELGKDASLQTGDLVDKFLRQYYKEAYAPMRDLFNIIRNEQVSLEKKGIYAYSFGEWLTLDNWSDAFISQCLLTIDSAYAAIEPLRLTDNMLFRELSERITRESIFPRYLQLVLYPYNVHDFETEKASFLAECTKFGMTGIKRL